MNHTTVVPENFEQEKTGRECPDCGQMLVYKEGCEECPNSTCGWSKR
jgi:ssDNA-binding Zn-finger/Zn-ribbon topoisomerase 1